MQKQFPDGIEWTDYTHNVLAAVRSDIPVELQGDNLQFAGIEAGSGRIVDIREFPSARSLKAGWFCDKPDLEGTCKNCYAESLNLVYGNGLKFSKENRDRVEWVWKDNQEEEIRKLNSIEGTQVKCPHCKGKKETIAYGVHRCPQCFGTGTIKKESVRNPGHRTMVFCGDMYDLFQPNIPKELLDRVFDLYDEMTNLTIQIQTTYYARMVHYFQARYKGIMPDHYAIGISAGTQNWLMRAVTELLKLQAAWLYVSLEPALERIDWQKKWFQLGNTKKIISQVQLGQEAVFDINKIPNHCLSYQALTIGGTDEDFAHSLLGNFPSPRINQVIFGGESGRNARPTVMEDLRFSVNQLKNIGENNDGNHIYIAPAIFVKQLGSKPVIHLQPLKLKDKKGGDTSEWSQELVIREFPKG